MTDATVETSVTGGQIQGVVGAGTVVIENLTIYNREIQQSVVADTARKPIPPCPYPGLAYFAPGDADLFFGRDAAITRLAEAVGRQSLTALAGPSGSGKSSIVLAGLAPRLHGAGGWRFSHFRIGAELDSDPFLALARAAVPLYVASQSETERLQNTRLLATRLQTGELTLRDVFADCRSRSKGIRILLIADQFEDAFISVKDEAIRHRFIDVLLAGFPDPVLGSSPDICLIVTLRADFFGHALFHRPLADALQGHVENLGPMNREELQAAIRRPAENTRVSFEPGLVEALLDDVESKPGSLPLLQFALRELWGRQEKRTLTRKSYDAIGGIEGALAQRAEAIFAVMTENGAKPYVVRDFQRLFTRLVALGEGQEDTRRVVDRRELGDEVWALAQRLAGEENRLVVTSAPGLSRETAEVVHEALIRHWPKLVDWIERDRSFLSWLRQIKSNVELWSVEPSDDGPLLRSGMLAQARDWLAQRHDDLSPAERGYIDASIALQRKEEEEREAARQHVIRREQELVAAVKLAAVQRQRARIAVIGGIVSFVFALLAIFAGYHAYTAQNQTQAALKQVQVERDRVRTQQLAIQARRSIEAASPEDVERAGALALESINLARKSNWPAEADALEVARSLLIDLPLGVLSQGSPVLALAVLVDGRLASGGLDGKIKLWPKDGMGVPEVLSQGSSVLSLAVLADGGLASGGKDGQIKVWPRHGTGEPVVLSHGSSVTSLAALADGRLASGGEDGHIKLWPWQGPGEPTVLLSHGSPITSLAVLADGRLASGDEDGRIKLWSKDGTGVPEVLSQGSPVSALAVLVDGRLASGGLDGKIKLWPKDGMGAPEVLSRGISVRSLTVLTDGRLASGGDEGNITVWSKEGADEPTILPQGGQVLALAVLADGRLAGGSSDGKIKLWTSDDPVVLSQGSPVFSLAMLTNGWLASGGDGKIELWPEQGTSQPVVLSYGSHVRVFALEVLEDGRLASGGEDGYIKLWPRQGGEPTVLSHGSPITSLAVLADGRLASGGEDGRIKLWSKDGTGELEVLSNGSPVTSLAVLPDGRLASGGTEGRIKLWPQRGLGEPGVLSQGSPVMSLAVLPGGRLASGGSDGTIKLWPRDGKGYPVVLSNGSPVTSLAVLPDGRLASGGSDGRIRLWPEDLAAELSPKDFAAEPEILMNGSPILSFAVLPDGRLASGDRDGRIKLWLVDEQQLIAALCLRVGGNLTRDEWARYIGSDTPWQPSCRGRPSNWRTPV